MQSVNVKYFTDSSVIKLTMWNASTQDLVIVFNSGSIWAYAGVPHIVWWFFSTSESPGNYFNTSIRGKFDQSCLYKPGVTLV